MDKVIGRLKDLYKARIEIEHSLVKSLRYHTDDVFIKNKIITLTELRGRVEELEMLLDTQTTDELKKQCGVI